MPINVEHGVDQSRYASLVGDSARKTEEYDRLRKIAEFMQQMKSANQDFQLGTEQNRLTGRGQDIEYDLGLKDVDLRGRGYDLQEVNQDRNYELGLRSQDLSELSQEQANALGLLGEQNRVKLGELDAVASSGDRAVNWLRDNYTTRREAKGNGFYYSRLF